jgi:TPR repeat protein
MSSIDNSKKDEFSCGNESRLPDSPTKPSEIRRPGFDSPPPPKETPSLKMRLDRHEEDPEMYQDAAEGGDLNARYKLAMCYYFGKGTKRNMEETVKHLQIAAESDHERSQYELSGIYKHGRDEIKKDTEKANFWLQKAAENGDRDAQYDLAAFYMKEKDNEKAKFWYSKLAENGERHAQIILDKLSTDK